MSLLDWRQSRPVGVVLTILSLSWVFRVLVFHPAYNAPIPHTYLAAAMFPILIAHLIGICSVNLELRKGATILMSALWIMVGVPTALMGQWQPLYFGFAICYAWLSITLARFILPGNDKQDEH
jgi:hypothetical protein